MDAFPSLSTALWVILFATFLLILARVIYALYFSPTRRVPGPAICKVTNLCLKYYDTRLLRNQKIYEWHQKYGSVVMIAPGEVSFSSALVAKEIYSTTAHYPKSSYFDYLTTYGFRSIFMARDPREHQRLRKRTFRCYQPSSIYKPSTLGFVRSHAKSARSQLRTDVKQDGTTIDVFLGCNAYSFDNITRFALGPYLCSNAISYAPEARRIYQGWEDCEVWGPLGFNFPVILSLFKFFIHNFRNDKSFLSGDERLRQWTSAQVALAADDPQKSGQESLLRQLLEVKNEENVSLPIDEIAEEILDNFLAAQSVVTNALVFLLWDLACHPEWQRKIRTELHSLPREKDGLPSYTDIEALPILDACLQESSRVHPLSSGRAERVVPVTKAYDQVIIPAGTIVSASTKALHYSSEVFPNPYLYDPTRWIQAKSDELLAMKISFMPYGQGARICLGIPFALAQMKLLVAFLLLEFEFHEDKASITNTRSMEQLGTQSALPRGLRCDLFVRPIYDGSQMEET